MHIALVTQDEELAQSWLAVKGGGDDRIELFQRPESLLGTGGGVLFEHIVLSDRSFELDGFRDYVEQLKERHPGADVTVLLSDRHDTGENSRWIKACLVAGLHFIPPHRTKDGVHRMLMRRIYGEETISGPPSAKVIAFVGSTPNIGTTFVSFGTAVAIAGRTERSVAYLCLNLKSSKLHRYLGIERPEATLDQLRAEIRSRSLKPERLRMICEQVKGRPNMRVLFGNMLREQAEYFTAEDIEHVLQTARQAFDVCIVEVNAYWDNAATVCALLQADTRILVTTPELTHFQEDTERWLRGLCPIIGLPAESFDLVLTQSDKSSGAAGIRGKDVRKETGLTLIGTVGRFADLNAAVNQGKLLELLLGPHPINRDLGELAGLMCAVCGIEEHKPARAPFWKRWTGRLAVKDGKAGRTLWEG